jgi:hypothetical protein
MLGMSDRVYQTADGVKVTLEACNWTGHILRRHPAITEQDVAQALTIPERICDHKAEPTQRVYQGAPRTTGFFWGSFPIAVVEMMNRRRGRVVTAYPATLSYQGRQRWP